MRCGAQCQRSQGEREDRSRGAIPLFEDPGLVCLSLVVGVLYAGGFLAFDGWALHGLPILGYGLIWLPVFLISMILSALDGK